MRSSKVLTMMPSGSDVASRAISFLTVLKNFLASAGWNSIFLKECVSAAERDDDWIAILRETQFYKQLDMNGQRIHCVEGCVEGCVSLWRTSLITERKREAAAVSHDNEVLKKIIW